MERRPLVVVAGAVKELPIGDTLPGGGGGGNIPFYIASGAQSNIPSIGGMIPFYLANGTQDDIPLV